MSLGNARYARHVKWAEEHLSADDIALHHKQWDPTPWVIDVRLRDGDDLSGSDIRVWCFREFGPESWPIHDRPANWLLGATVHGHTWMGFATDALMQRFIRQFPDRIWPELEP